MTKRFFKNKDGEFSLALDSSFFGNDKPDIWARINRGVKITGLVLLSLVIAWCLLGTPYIRWDDTLVDGKDGTDLKETDLAFTRYISFGDSRRVHAGEYGDGLPWLIFIPLGDSANGAAGDDDVFVRPDAKRSFK